jgi:hypothetical protein
MRSLIVAGIAAVLGLASTVPSVPALAAGDPPKPRDEINFISTVSDFRTQYNSGGNEMQRGSTRVFRKDAICERLHDLNVTNWIGKVTRLTTNGDGNGIVNVEIADDLTLETNNNSISDALNPTMISPHSPLFQKVASLHVNQLVRFSGNFFESSSDCILELSLTISGSMNKPEFEFRFSDIASADEPAPSRVDVSEAASAKVEATPAAPPLPVERRGEATPAPPVAPAADPAPLSCSQLKIARNEIFARQGYSFRNPELVAYFAKQAWYHPAVNDISAIVLTPADEHTVAAIKAVESLKGCGTPVDPPPTPAALASAPPARSPMYQKGLLDRTNWEKWLVAIPAENRAGAEFWASQRSLKTPGSCYAGTPQFTEGCQVAKVILDPSDVLRKGNADYKAGWNAY